MTSEWEHGANEDVYHLLREFLDGFPLGFPATASGVEIRILRKLFSPEEAETAVLLSPMPEEVERIAARSGRDAETLAEMLETMSGKGLVFRSRHEGRTLYNAAPFMIGLYEYSVGKMDGELAALYKEYYETAYLEEMGASGVPGFRVFPVAESIEADVTLYPFLDLVERVKEARVISVAECICRKEAHLTGGGCDRPMETCLSFGVAAEYYIENGIGREISPAEAIAILEEADGAGLVHAGVNTRHLSNICNCCPCCCASMKGITREGMDKHLFMNALFEAVVDEDACTACGDCVERCPVGAIALEDTARVDRGKCLGCGLCAGACPGKAVRMLLRDDREEPFDRVLHMGMAIMEGKRKAYEGKKRSHDGVEAGGADAGSMHGEG
ncbi:MAG: 4Fe-4S dicluster domain-containing protein [Actinobacteria bacterium]|jgi:Pyruvate/2-oxoacid:ferredoxin oxidoreductase delta subunit|nr:MAG: 4Fe-4S dicluster domain-containing protein [Actinomycetota bacterium]